jgi:hypothetical protein
MSANNWTECPRCRARVRQEIADRKRRAAEAYGTIPADEWKALDDAARLIPQPTKTFREDWEIGVEGETLVVSYSGGCTECGLGVTFNHKQPIDLT